MPAYAMDLKYFALRACYSEACRRVCDAQLALLRSYFLHYGPHKQGPFDFSIIEQVNQGYLKEERRRERLLDALAQHAKARHQGMKLAC